MNLLHSHTHTNYIGYLIPENWFIVAPKHLKKKKKTYISDIGPFIYDLHVLEFITFIL